MKHVGHGTLVISYTIQVTSKTLQTIYIKIPKSITNNSFLTTLD